VSQVVKYAIVVGAVIAMAVALLLPPSTQAGPELNDPASRVRAAINSLRFVAYTPTDLTIVAGQVHPASRERIHKDLTLLREDFQGLITYSCADGVDEMAWTKSQLSRRRWVFEH